MKTVYVSPDAITFRPEEHHVPDVRAFLVARFNRRWPPTARLYHLHVADSHDITPSSEASWAAVDNMPGPFHVVVFPAGPAAPYIYFALFVASLAASYFLRPQLPKPKEQRNESPNNSLSSRNNRERVTARIPDVYGTVRSVPDLLAVPWSRFEAHEEVEESLLCVGRGHYEIERVSDGGPFDVRDGSTRIDTIRGAAVEVYAPNEPVPGEPQIRIGNPISGAIRFPTKSAAVAGQMLPARNDKTLTVGVVFKAPNEIHLPAESTQDFTSYFTTDGRLTVANAAITLPQSGHFKIRWNGMLWGGVAFADGQVLPDVLAVGDIITIGQLWDNIGSYAGTYRVRAISYGDNFVVLETPDGGHPPWYNTSQGAVSDWLWVAIAYPGSATATDMSGSYEVLAVDPRVIVVDDPAWGALSQFQDGVSPLISVTLSMTGLRWVGPVVVDTPNLSSLMLNFIAEQGIYVLDENGTQYGTLGDASEPYAGTPIDPDSTALVKNGIVQGVRVRVEVQQLDAAEAPVGAPETMDYVVGGSAVTKRTRARTAEFRPSWATGQHTGKCTVRVARVTPVQSSSGDTYVDEVSWRDLYAMCDHPGTSFGDVTVVRTLQRASAGAFALKERRLNLLVTRKLPKPNADYTGFTDELYPTRNAADILCAVCLDPKIGRRRLDEIDIRGVYQAIAAVVAHFNAQTVVGEFSHTFDDVQTSFEETVTAIASAAFCVAYRQGSKIRLKPELPTDSSTILFNHRNKMPGTETRTVRFGSKYDGVELTYTSPKDDSRVTVYLPADMSARNPERIDLVGVRSRVQAYYHAARARQRQLYERVAVEFDGLEDAKLALRLDRVLVADNTRAGVLDGEVLSQDGLVLHLSQEVDLTDGAARTVFLQHTDGTVESLGVSQGYDSRHVVLAKAPRTPLFFDPDGVVKPRYWIVENVSSREQAFLVVEKEPRSGYISTLRLVNYDERYYEHDTDWPSEDEMPFGSDPVSADYLWSTGGYVDEATADAVLAQLAVLVTVDLPANDYDVPARPAAPGPLVAVTISPWEAEMYTDQTLQFTATVANAANTVSWSCSAGSITAGGLFTPPADAQTVVVTATSTVDPTKSASAVVDVLHVAQYLIDAYGSEATANAVIERLSTLVTVDLPANDYDYP